MPMNASPPRPIDRLVAAWHDRAIVLKAMSFGAVGVVNAIVDATVFWIAARKLGIPIIPANVLAWVVGVSGSYVMNSMVTFARESGRKLSLRAYLTFAASGIFGLIANTTTLVVALSLMPQLTSHEDLQLAGAKACAIGASFLVNFSLSHFVVFRARRP
jgi:putative flippase GtrA